MAAEKSKPPIEDEQTITSDDVAKIKVGEGTTGRLAQYQAVRGLLHQMSTMATLDTNENKAYTQLATVEAIMSAEDEDEMWDADERGPLGGRDLPNIEQRIFQVIVKYSRDNTLRTMFVDNEGKHMYLMVDAMRLDTMEQIQWDTSAPALVAKLMWLNQRDKFPYDCVIRDTELGAGQAVLKLKRIPPRQEVI